MKEIKVTMDRLGLFAIDNSDLRIGIETAGIMGVTGPGTLKVEFVPEPEWPEEPGCEEWRGYWFEGEGKMIRYLLEDGVSRARMVCGMSAAGWWFEKSDKLDIDSDFHAKNTAKRNALAWLKWSKGEEWR